jgi:fido (protein-threonine AMPylation protein)
MEASIPWYRQHDRWAARANHYVDALARLPKNEPHHRQLAAFADFSKSQFIFESNLIEGAGLPEGDTRKLVDQYFPKLPSSYEAFRESQQSLFDYIVAAQKLVESLADTVHGSGLRPKRITPTFQFAKRSRPILEVARHSFALSQAILFTCEFGLEWVVYQTAKDHPSIRTDPEFLKLFEEMKGKGELKQPIDVPPQLITEEAVCTLHECMASGLLPKDAGVPAGQYRIDNRIVGWDIVFPAPELIPAAMQRYLVRAQEALVEALGGRLDRFFAAAQISYDFVRIHPFPDFNGRVSRLLLMMVLNACGVPFPVTLRGDSKSKRRYFRALKFGNAGNLKPYAALIAMRVVQAFEEVENNLTIAGLPSILSFSSTSTG